MKNIKIKNFMLGTLVAFLISGLFPYQTTSQTTVKGPNVTKVFLGKDNAVTGILVQVGPKEWNQYYPDGKRLFTTHTETGRDEWSVYLKSPIYQYVQIDLWLKVATYENNGKTTTYEVLSSSNDPVKTTPEPTPVKTTPEPTPVKGTNITRKAIITNKTLPTDKTIVTSKTLYYEEDAQLGSHFSDRPDPYGWIYEASRQWMSNLPDSIRLRDISLPGTHDSGARYGGIAAQTQTWTITKQLNAGIRFLDIRGRPTGKTLAIHHGAFFQNQMFGDVMNEAVRFLKENPSETIVMRVSANEHTPQPGSETAAQIWDRYRNSYQDYLYQGYNTNPMLFEVKGKIFVMLHGCKDCSHNGMWANSDKEVMEQQNYYQVFFLPHKQTKGSDWATLPSKKEKVRESIDKAENSKKWIINYLSGSTGMAPNDVARRVNGDAYEYLGTRSGKRKLGVIISDFPGEKLIYRIIKSNFDYSKKCSCAAKVFRTASQKTWVEFRLPSASSGTKINISNGAFSKYVFPSCNRVYWSDLDFTCNPNTCQWEKTNGNWGSDILCHGSKGNSPYVFTGIIE
jgi:hypothetical protein